MGSIATASAKPLSFMEKLDPLVSVYRPPEASSPSSAGDPRLIIIGGWTDARDVHVAKYVTKYQSLYPAAHILLLKSTITQIFQPWQIGPAMKHAVPVVRAVFPTGTSASSSPELVVHVFSNGGCSSLANLYEQYSVSAGPGEDKAFPPHVTIFDSCPGLYSITHAVAFLNTSLSPLQRLVAAPILYPLATAISISIALGVAPNSLRDWGNAQNDHEANKAELRRAYIYSATDALIDDKVVEAHAADAVSKGFNVKLEKYEGSAHVAHLRTDENRYWEIVRTIVHGDS